MGSRVAVTAVDSRARLMDLTKLACMAARLLIHLD